MSGNGESQESLCDHDLAFRKWRTTHFIWEGGKSKGVQRLSECTLCGFLHLTTKRYVSDFEVAS